MSDYLASMMPPNASAHGPHLDFLNEVVHWLMLVLLVFWGLYFLFVLYRFRSSRNPRANYVGVKSHVSSYAEAGVALVEAIILIGLAIPAWSKWVTPNPIEGNPLEIRVVAEQFAWNVHYPGDDGIFGRSDPSLVTAMNPTGLDRADPNAKDDIISLNQLHLEVDRPTTIRLTSKDVIHSFFLPVMRVKQDAIPGYEVPVYFTPVETSEGKTWEIACAQLCGLGHYRMRGQLIVHSKNDFEAWLTASAPAPEEPTG